MNEHPVILFDGVCNFCDGMVNFVIRQDKKALFRFAPLQSENTKMLLQPLGLSTPGMDSFIFLEKGNAYTLSTAALRVCRHLPWYWQWTQLFWIVPKIIRDVVYRYIARNRYKWFGRKDECVIPSPELKARFLP